jgi:hypothetical protein
MTQDDCIVKEGGDFAIAPPLPHRPLEISAEFSDREFLSDASPRLLCDSELCPRAGQSEFMNCIRWRALRATLSAQIYVELLLHSREVLVDSLPL